MAGCSGTAGDTHDAAGPLPDAHDAAIASPDVVDAAATLDVATTDAVVSHTDAADAAPHDAGTPDFLRGVYQGPRADGIAAYQTWLGPHAVTVVGDYGGSTSWSSLEGPLWIIEPGPPTWRTWVAADPTHRMVNVGVLPWSGTGTLHDCAAGTYDTHYRAMGTNYVNAGMGHTIFRFAWEEDGNWFPWTTQSQTGGAWHYDATLEADFAGCFRHFSRAIHATDPQAIVSWDGSDSAAFDAAVYPGDDVVDMVSCDQYDWTTAPNTYPFPAGCDTACQNARQTTAWNTVFGPHFLAIANFATLHHKPFSIGEWGVGGHSNTVPAPDAGLHNDNGGLDDPIYIQNIDALMRGTLPGLNPGFVPGFSSYFEALADEGKTDTRLVTSATYTTRYPNAAARYRALFGM